MISTKDIRARRGRIARFVALIAVVAATGLLASTAAAAATLINGDFETGDLTGWTTFVTPNGGIEPAGVALFDTTGSGASYAAYFTVGEVTGQVGNGPPEGGGIYQNVTVSGGTYELSADIASFGGFNADCGTYELIVDGGVVASQVFGECLAIGTYRSKLNATVSLTAGSHEIRVLITRRYGPAMTQHVDNIALVPLDNTAPTISVPAPITVNATSANGASVTYGVSASDPDDAVASLTCVPASGSTFPIGTTTVTCTATDTDGNSSTASFTVQVEGAAEQLADLGKAVTGVGPGTSLADKVKQAQASLAGDGLADTCSTLTAFVNEVKAQSGKTIAPGQALALIASANRITTVLGC